MSLSLRLTSRWTPAEGEIPSVYELILSNDGSESITGFSLGFSGPAANIDPHAKIGGGTLRSRLSTYSLIAAPEGYVLAPGESWTVSIRSLAHALRHWTDGARGAYLVLADGRVVDVAVSSTIGPAGDVRLHSGAMAFPVPAAPAETVSIIPWPSMVAVSGTRPAQRRLHLEPDSPKASAAVRAFGWLVAELFPNEHLIASEATDGLRVAMRSGAGLGAEAYEIEFEDEAVRIVASTQIGFTYGLITLGQIVRGAREHPGKIVVPATGRIADTPALRWRGTHLDVARRFYPTSEIRRLLAILSWNKMNRFHWHLSDDEAWRIEIDAYPALTGIGAWRGHGLPLPPLLGSGAQRTGGYYSKADVREIVAFGQDLGIDIVPEIDIPGHCYAALAALPELRDEDDRSTSVSIQGFPRNCLNPAHEPVYRFIETVVDEMLEVFPSRIFHLGADEVPLAAWSGSPKALALLEKLASKTSGDRHRTAENPSQSHGLADEIEGSGTAALQAHFIARVHRYISGKGAITGGWEEAAHGGVLDKKASYLVGWRSVEVSAALAREGYDIVASPGQRYYLDMANGPDWSEPGAGWAGWSAPEETYRFEPRAGWSATELAHLLGVQSCIWSEPMADPAVFDRLVFPRLSAIAETGWTQPEHKSWERFRAFAGLMPTMYGMREE